MIITQHLQWVDTNISNIKYATEWTVIPFPHVEEEEEKGDGWKGGSVINPTNLAQWVNGLISSLSTLQIWEVWLFCTLLNSQGLTTIGSRC